MAERDAGVTNAAVAGDVELPPNFESILPDYPVRLTNFEGPLDLLIHLIKKNEVDIYDIPIVLISQQYIEYLDLMREIDLDVAGEFLVMAATLIHIKSRMLVPRVEAGLEGDEPAEDPREALVQRLLDHQRFKAAAEMLHECETVRSAQWTRPDERVEQIAGAPFERELEVDLFSLLQAFQAVLTRARSRGGRRRAARRGGVDRGPHGGDDRAAGRQRAVRVRGAVRRRRVPPGPHHDVSGDPGADPAEAHSGLPGRRLRSDPRVPARSHGERDRGGGARCLTS